MAGKKIDEEKVEEEILYFLRVNERLRYAGFLLNQWASSNNHNVSMIEYTEFYRFIKRSKCKLFTIDFWCECY